MLADCYQRCLHPKLCIHEALPFASCVQGCGRTSETRLCCPTCIEPGNSILWYLHLAAIHAFFLHSAEPSVKLVEIVFTHSTKCISRNLFKKITVHNMHLFKDPSETTRAFRQSGLMPQFTRFSVSGRQRVFCRGWVRPPFSAVRSVLIRGGRSWCFQNLPGKGEKCIRWN